MIGRSHSGQFWTAVGISLAAFVLLVPTAPPVAPSFAGTYSFAPASTHLKHLITVVMENRDYDTYFGEYCLTLGPYCRSVGNGIPSGTCVPYTPSNVSMGCVTPFNFTANELQFGDLPHNWDSGSGAWDAGAMDGFYNAEGKSTTTFGHYNGSTLPIYWDLAEQYASSDNTFAGNLSYSLPNHWALVSGTIPDESYGTWVNSGTERYNYLQQANGTSTIQDLLNRTNVSWKYYDWSLYPYSRAVNTTGGTTDGSAFNYWNPMAGRGESYQSAYNSHFVPRSSFLSDATSGNLPQLSWVIPPWQQSDHPGTNVTAGEQFVAQLVDAVEASPDWNSTAIVLVWDDYGGFYDHVAPPTRGGDLLSFRSPTIVISPFAREDYINHQPLDFFSFLHFAEWQFGLGCLTVLDCNATMPFGFFDFNQTARSPINFQTNPVIARYPMPLQKLAYGQIWNGGYHPVPPLAWNANDTLPPGVSITDAA